MPSWQDSGREERVVFRGGERQKTVEGEKKETNLRGKRRREEARWVIENEGGREREREKSGDGLVSTI